MWYVSLCGLLVLMFWLFTKNKKRKLDTPEVYTSDKVVLHGHDLSKWNYLGVTECSYVGENGKITSSYPIFFFVDKKNEKKRSFYVATDLEYVKNNHTYITKYVKPWAAGESEIWRLIANKRSEPSDYLREYMADKFGTVWDVSTHRWVPSNDAKYTAAKKKQTSTKKPPNQGSGGKKDPVVVQVDFRKKNNED